LHYFASEMYTLSFIIGNLSAIYWRFMKNMPDSGYVPDGGQGTLPNWRRGND